MALNKGYEIHYDKYQVFSNIRYHLNKNPNVKIGQIDNYDILAHWMNFVLKNYY